MKTSLPGWTACLSLTPAEVVVIGGVEILGRHGLLRYLVARESPEAKDSGRHSGLEKHASSRDMEEFTY